MPNPMEHERSIGHSPEGVSWKAIISNMELFRRQRIAVKQDGEFAQADAANLAYQIPVLYSVIVSNILVMMYTFQSSAPPLLTLWLPLPLIAICCVRAIYWLPVNVRRRPSAVTSRDVERLPKISAGVSFVAMCWGLLLYDYGSQAQQSIVHYIISVTILIGILALAKSPKSAIYTVFATLLPSNIVFGMIYHPNQFIVIVLQTILSILVLIIAIGFHKNFVNLILARQKVALWAEEVNRLSEINREIATLDPLTGVNNRRAILTLLEQELADPAALQPWLALIDLDGFKHINDTFGHAAGDEVLCATSMRIKNVPEIELFGRMGGDEFAILLPGNLNYLVVRAVLTRLSRAVSQPIAVDGQSLLVRASIGLHRCTSTNIGECMERADFALYKSKRGRSGAVAKFTALDECVRRDRRAATQVFTSSNLGSRLKLLYQPVIDTEASRPVTFEALVRWSPDGTRWLPPAAFIELAETTGRICELTSHVLTKALDECRTWQWGCSLAVNLSALDILRADSVRWIGGIVATAGAPPSSIILEITETALLKDYRRAADHLEKLRNMGFRIALDDFGTGQSSLSHLYKLPFDYIKIDQSFARNLVHSDDSKAIVGTILMLARQMRMECIIEGVETLEQQLVARSLGVRMMQGFHFGRPVKAVDALASLQANRSVEAAYYGDRYYGDVA